MKEVIAVAGGTGSLGLKIVNALIEQGAEVSVIARPESDPEKIKNLEKIGAKIIRTDYSNTKELAKALTGVTCVVSALSGLRDVIIDAQKTLLDAAVSAGVPRFIPSDFSIDFTNLKTGENRNLDLRREFHKYLEKADIKATTIFNGAFTELLTGEMPMILFGQKRIMYYGNADQRMDFTTMHDTAAFTARAALDSSTPRYLKIAGDQVSPRELAGVVSEITSKKFRLFRPGGLGLLRLLIKIARFIAPAKNDLYPAWQGMQYMHNMLEGRAKFQNTDNMRYPEIHFTTAKQWIAANRK